MTMRMAILLVVIATATGTVAQVPPVGAPAPGAPSRTPVEDAALKRQTAMVCRSSVPIGSLISGHKTCKTRKQWDEQSNDAERDARHMVEESRTKVY